MCDIYVGFYCTEQTHFLVSPQIPLCIDVGWETERISGLYKVFLTAPELSENPIYGGQSKRL